MELLVKKVNPNVVIGSKVVKLPKPKVKAKKEEPTPTVLTVLTVEAPVKVEPVVTPKVKAPKVKKVEVLDHRSQVVEPLKVLDTVDLTKFQKGPAIKNHPNSIGKPIVKNNPNSVGKPIVNTDKKPYVNYKDTAKVVAKGKNSNHIVWRNFDIQDYDAILAIVKSANAVLGKDVVTISKTAKVDYVVDAAYGSIWYSCGSAAFREHFRKPFELLYIALEFGMTPITKAEAIALPFGSKLTMAYVKNDLSNIDAIDVIDNIKVETDQNEGIYYKGASDPTEMVYLIPYGNISDNGSFNDGVEGEMVYLYVDTVE